MEETTKLENAYRRFGNVAFVDPWFKAECFAGPIIRNADSVGKVLLVTRNTGKPIWYKPVIQLEYRPAERLLMDKRLDFALATYGKSYLMDSLETARDLELIARQKPKKDWRVELISAFESLIYQRQGRNKWVLIEIGRGYA